jgi:hypothetical protein
VVNLSNKVKILDLLKGGMSLAEVEWQYGKNDSGICSTVLNSMHFEHWWFFLNGGLLGATEPRYEHLLYKYTVGFALTTIC